MPAELDGLDGFDGPCGPVEIGELDELDERGDVGDADVIDRIGEGAHGMERMKAKVKVPTEYRGYRLDPFQREAIRYLEAGHSVLVSAPTGVGKTLVADYLIERMFRGQPGLTAPIKALSSQKYKEFKRLLGRERRHRHWGRGYQQWGSDQVMTTGIFRNMPSSPEALEGVSHVIFDEIHYLADGQGTVGGVHHIHTGHMRLLDCRRRYPTPISWPSG